MNNNMHSGFVEGELDNSLIVVQNMLACIIKKKKLGDRSRFYIKTKTFQKDLQADSAP